MSTVLTVGAGQQYNTVNAAILAANQIGNDVTIKILAGTYVNDGGTITAGNVTVEGMGGLAKLVGASPATGGKAAITASGSNILLTNLDISGVSNAGGAGVLDAGGTLRLDEVHLHDNQTGLAAADALNGTLNISDCVIDHNGSASGSGNIDVGSIATLTLYDSYVHDALGGSEVRSTAQNLSVTYTLIADNTGTAAHAIDLPKGGSVSIAFGGLERGPNATSRSIISYGASGTTYANSSVSLNFVNIYNDVYPNAASLFDTASAAGSLTDNYTWNLPSLGVASTHGFTASPAHYTYFPPGSLWSNPSITSITGMSDGGVTLRGWAPVSNGTVTVADTVDGKTTLLGTATTQVGGIWSLTNHVKIDLGKIHAYTFSAANSDGSVSSTTGALYLTDTGTDHLTSAVDTENVFSIMSFKGADVIDMFKTSGTNNYHHDVINFSGRGITSFAQVQAMMSGSSSTVLTFGSGKTVTLTGVAPNTLSGTDFVYS